MSYTPIGGRRFVRRDEKIITNTDSVEADGGSEDIGISPPEGEIWDIKTIEFDVTAIESSSTGEHEFRFANYDGTSYPSILRVFQDSNSTLRFTLSRVNIKVNDAEIFGSNENDDITAFELNKQFQKFINDTVLLSHDDQITLRYRNESDMATEEEREYTVRYDVYE